MAIAFWLVAFNALSPCHAQVMGAGNTPPGVLVNASQACVAWPVFLNESQTAWARTLQGWTAGANCSTAEGINCDMSGMISCELTRLRPCARLALAALRAFGPGGPAFLPSNALSGPIPNSMPFGLQNM
ncbi:unnamed protein product [Closterium sp. NIES-64]|nr:unnamed protein product [Closterium sp. NIES-64]